MKKIYRLVFLGIAFLLILFYYFFDPMKYVWMPKCMFHEITGLQCMGCGSQRMIHNLLQGNFTEAFHANALLFLSMPIICFLIIIELFRPRFPCLYAKTHSKALIITAAVMLLIWLPVRNILGM